MNLHENSCRHFDRHFRQRHPAFCRNCCQIQSILVFQTPNPKKLPMSSRRDFLQAGLVIASSFSVAACSASTEKKTASTGNSVPECLDYGRSFLCNSGKSKASNSVRMWIESRTIVRNTKTGSEEIYYQGASCKSEDTFAEKDLFYKDNYDFLPIFGKEKVLVFRRHFDERSSYRKVQLMSDMWGPDPIIRLPHPRSITLLDTFEKIREATLEGVPIVTQTEITDEATGLSALIECPCKTMNVNSETRMYQTDTGPVVLPDLSKTYDEPMDALRPAFIAFNAPHFADFVVEAPVAITDNGKTVRSVLHYSELITHKATNRIYAVD